VFRSDLENRSHSVSRRRVADKDSDELTDRTSTIDFASTRHHCSSPPILPFPQHRADRNWVPVNYIDQVAAEIKQAIPLAKRPDRVRATPLPAIQAVAARLG
jgi:hypothetical protein